MLVPDGFVPDSSMGTFVPSHVAPTHVQEGAISLVGVKDIDTEKLLIDGKPPVAGVAFVPETTHDAWAVLSVKDFTVSSDLLVHGRRSFILVAVGSVKLSAVIHAGASSRTPGPGGQYTGIGHGGDGKTTSNQDSGGGGGGFGTVGADGGPSQANNNFEGGVGGPTYTVELGGGSGGGQGAGSKGCTMNQGWSEGGAGGGAVQISAKLGIDIDATGGINAGGGGGRGGCSVASAGGGGGSGGTIWLEAPSIRVVGKLAANGGAGGSGGSNEVVRSDFGIDGQDGALSANPAAGGPPVGANSGKGGSGAALLSATALPGGKSLNGGGGGGGMGRIRVRTRGASPITAPETLISPLPEKSVDF